MAATTPCSAGWSASSARFDARSRVDLPRSFSTGSVVGDGIFVYALAATAESDQVVMAGHFRGTLSASGTKAERGDPLSKSLVLSPPIKSGSKGGEAVALCLIQLVSDKPVETLIYTANLAKKDIYVRTPDGTTCGVGKGKMRVSVPKPSN